MKPSRAPLVVAVVMLSLPLLYIASYLLLVVPAGRMVFHPTDHFPGYEYVCHYRIDSDTILPAVYWPLERLDRKIRPAAWERMPRLIIRDDGPLGIDFEE